MSEPMTPAEFEAWQADMRSCRGPSEEEIRADERRKVAEEIAAVRDEEMDDLRAELKTVEGQRDDYRKALKNASEEAAYCIEALNGAENRRQMWRQRAEQAERRLAEFRRYIDEDFRFWCSPHGVAGRYARDLIDYLDRLDGQEDDRGHP